MQSGCHPCHEECTSCVDGSASCGLDHPPCRHYQQGRECVTRCSRNHYVDQRSRVICLPCHLECVSCSGPSDYHCDQCRFLTVYEYSTNTFLDDGLHNSTVQDVGYVLILLGGPITKYYYYYYYYYYYLAYS